jgi:hypothetical protein
MDIVTGPAGLCLTDIVGCPTVSAMAGDRYPRLDIRADQALLERLDRLAAALGEPGVNVKRSGAARAALLRGLAVLEQARGIAPKEKEKPARKPATSTAKKKTTKK